MREQLIAAAWLAYNRHADNLSELISRRFPISIMPARYRYARVAARNVSPAPTVSAISTFGVSTKEAYRNIDYSAIGCSTEKTSLMRKALERGDRDTILQTMHNDFEISVFPQLPRLGEIKKELLEKGCSASVMSGSGSTVIGVAESRERAQDIADSLSIPAIVASTLS